MRIHKKKKISHNGGKFRIDYVRAFNSLAALIKTNGCTLKLVNGEYETCKKQKKVLKV
jgi:hypothetical protein